MSTKTCPVCGKPTPSPRATYCSASCRVKAMRQKRKDEGLTARGTAPVTQASVADPEALQKAIEDSLSKSAKERLEAATRARMRRIDAEVDHRARQQFAEWSKSSLGHVWEKLEEVEKRLKQHLKVQRRDKLLTPDEYKTLKKVLYPVGNPSEEVRRKAWEIWEKLGFVPLTEEDLKRMEEHRQWVEKVRKGAGL